MSAFITYQFKQCVVRYFPETDYLETVFQDGLKCPAQFTFTPNDLCKAVDLRYPAGVSGVTQMHLEHELSHTFIAEALGEPYCHVLRSVAVKGPCPDAWPREELIMDWQRYLNGKAATLQMLADLGPGVIIGSMIDFCRRFRK